MKFLVDYTKRHFTAEEEIMMNSGYPGLSNHNELHKTLINEVMGVLLGLKEGQTIEPNKLVSFLSDWLINHILEEDKKIGEHIAHMESTNKESVPNSPLNLSDLMLKLKKLKTLFTQKLISEQDYIEKKSHFLNDMGVAGKDGEQKDILQRFEFLSELLEKKLITKAEAKTSKTMILEKNALDEVLSDITDVENQFQFLKKLLDDGVLASDQYDEIKSKLLMDI